MIGKDRRFTPSYEGVIPLASELINSDGFLRETRFSLDSLNLHLAVNPGLSFLDTSTGQFIIGGYWRRRPEIAAILEISAGDSQGNLFEAFKSSARKIGCELLVADMAFREGDIAQWPLSELAEIDSIVEFQKVGSDIEPTFSPKSRPRRYRPEDLTALVALERASFPWIWWNSVAELIAYSEAKASEVWVIDDPTSGLSGYLGITVRDRLGHLDRLAVAPSSRRQGLGGDLVRLAMARFFQHGVRRISLTTQADNLRAQMLYEHFGFRRTPFAITIHGRWLGRPRDRTP